MTIDKEPGEDHGTRTANAVNTRNGRARVKSPSKLHAGLSGRFTVFSDVGHVSTRVRAQGAHVPVLPHD